MPMRAECGRVKSAAKVVAGAVAMTGLLLMSFAARAQHAAGVRKADRPQCRRAVVEGAVHAGQGFQVEFARRLVVGLEPIQSGWALRVVAAGKPRGPHDYAEVATLPYQSVSPLLLSTDWAFRSQDAAGWTPRRFRYAGSEKAYATLAAGYDAVVRGDAAASREAALLSEAQPEGVLEIAVAKIAPGMADQVGAAAAVSARFTETPHTIDLSAKPSPLGRLEDVRFRVLLDLPDGVVPMKGTKIATFPCVLRPTGGTVSASQARSKRK